MKCPKCSSNKKLKKIPDLRTLRTLADNGRVRRQRVCDKCKSRMWTVELLEDEYSREKADERDKLYKEESAREDAEIRFNRIKELHSELRELTAI